MADAKVKKQSKKRKAEEEEEEEEEEEPEVFTADVMEKKAWLLRVPNKLGEKWHQAQAAWREYHEAKRRADRQPNNQFLQNQADAMKKKAEQASDLGKISIQPRGGGSAEGKLTVQGQEGEKPQEYTMNLEGGNQRVGNLMPHFRILTEKTEMDEAGDTSSRLRIDATVTDYWTVQDNTNAWVENQKAIAANRHTAASLVEDDDEETVSNNYIRPLQQHELNNRHAAAQERRPMLEARTERKSKDAVINDLFELFREQELWTFKDLKERTSQPDQHLKDCLKDIAGVYDSGPNKGKWHLSDEYRVSGGGGD